MTTITQIQESILSLGESEFVELKRWLGDLETERRWTDWDEQIEAGSDAGKLGFLLAEAMTLEEARGLRGNGWKGNLASMRSDGSCMENGFA